MKSATRALVLALCSWAGVCRANEFTEALAAVSPHPSLGEAADLYGQFIGVWDVAVTNYPTVGAPTHATGEWIFAWVMEGQAVQDVWIVPARGTRTDSESDTFGTTLRYYVPDEDVWRVVWVNPKRDSVERMSARQMPGEIVQEGRDEGGGLFRWVFFDIEPDRFRWRAEQSTGSAPERWVLLQEMTVTRRTAAR